MKDLGLEEAKEIEFFTQRIERAWFLDILVGVCFHRYAKASFPQCAPVRRVS
jgi:hypothetical protein